MRKQSTSAFPAPRDDEELARLVQELTQVAGGTQDRKPNPDGGQEVIPSKGYVVELSATIAENYPFLQLTLGAC